MSVDLNPQVIARVREAADILEVVGDHVSLKRRGRRWTGLCPFHQEKTPSVSVDPERGRYYCFGWPSGVARGWATGGPPVLTGGATRAVSIGTL